MRIRTIKPEFWTDKRVSSWDLFTRLLYIGLWSAADDYGNGSAEHARLAAELFPYDLSTNPRECLASVSRGLATLSAEGRIGLFEADGETYYAVLKWSDHQRVDRPSKSRIPKPLQNTRVISSSDSRVTRVKNPQDQGTGNGNREQGGEWERTTDGASLTVDQALAEFSKSAVEPAPNYTREEIARAVTALSVNGWRWGLNPIRDPLSAIATKIDEERNKNGKNRNAGQQVNPRNQYVDKSGGNDYAAAARAKAARDMAAASSAVERAASKTP